MIIQFVKNHIPYFAGQCAHFPPEIAAKYLTAGLAVEYRAPQQEIEPEPKPARTPMASKTVKK